MITSLSRTLLATLCISLSIFVSSTLYAQNVAKPGNALVKKQPMPTPKPVSQSTLHNSELTDQQIGAKPWWEVNYPLAPPLITVLGNIAIACFVYRQFLKNYEQKDREIKQKESQIADERLRFNEKLNSDVEQFSRKRLDDQFDDIQNRFSSNDPAMRAYAAIRVGKFAETKGSTVENTDLGLLDKYPFFVASTTYLVTAMGIEQHETVRSAILKSLVEMIDFIKQTDQRGLRILADSLIGLNQATVTEFIRALVVYKAVKKDNLIDDILLATCPFCGDNFVFPREIRHTYIALDTIIKSKVFEAESVIYTGRNVANSDADNNANLVTAFDDVAVKSKSLIQVRDVLAYALRAIQGDPDSSSSDDPLDDSMVIRGNRDALHMYACFLVGADLSKSWLKGCYMVDTWIQGARLDGCTLDEAILARSDFTNATLYKVSARRANFVAATLDNAQCQGSDISGSLFTFSSLRGTNFNGARMRNTRFKAVRINRSQRDFDLQNDFENVDWSVALIDDPNLLEWLRATYPIVSPQSESLS